MSEEEYILVSNLKALQLTVAVLREVLLLDDDDYACVLDGKLHPEFPNLNANEFNRIRGIISMWQQSLHHYIDLENRG